MGIGILCHFAQCRDISKYKKKYLKDTIFKFRATRLNYNIHMLSKYNIF